MSTRSRAKTVRVKQRVSEFEMKSFNAPPPPEEPVRKKYAVERYKPGQKRLPEDFADKVLSIELDIENDMFTIEDLNELLYLYSQAVEYYNGTNNERAGDYTDKIQRTLMREEVLRKMNEQSRDPQRVKDNDAEINRKKEERKTLDMNSLKELREKEQAVNKKKRAMKFSLYIANQEEKQDTQKEVIMKEHHTSIEQSDEAFKRDIISQSDSLQRRLAMRRQIKSCRNSSAKSFRFGGGLSRGGSRKDLIMGGG